MSKLLKRTFALALVFCMLLSVIPAVSADFPAADAVVYNFVAAYNNGTKISSPTGVTETLYNEGALYQDANSTKPLNWYYMYSTSTTNTKFNNYGIYFGASNYAHWHAFVIDVPTAGTYDLTAKIYAASGYADTGRLSLIKATDGAKAVTGTGGNKFGSYTKAVDVFIDYTLRNTSGGKEGYVYLGNTYLEAGEYVLALQKDSTATGNYHCLTSLTLTPNTTSSFVDLINAHDCSAIESDRPIYQLAADLEAPAANLVLKNAELALRGKNLTVNSISTNLSGVNAKYNSTYGITDTVGTSVVKASSIELPEGQAKLPLKTAAGENTYMLYEDTTTVYTEPKNAIGLEEENAKAFGFNIALPEEAYGCDFSDVMVTLDVVVEGHTANAFCDYTNTEESVGGVVADWAASNGAKAFYVNIANYDLLAGETLQFRVTVTANGATHVTTASYAVPEA